MALDPEPGTSDAALIARYAAGDHSAARALTARLAPGVLALARRMLGDAAEAEDVAQEAMLRLWKIAPKWEAGRAKPSTWLYRVTQNLCTDKLRKRRGTGLDDAPEPVDEAAGALDTLIATDRAAALRAAMETLPDRQRLALHLRHFEELSNIEIAEIMEVSVDAVESLLGRAKRALAHLLVPQREQLGLG